MNLTISKVGVSTWKRIKLSYISAACGATLALSAAVAIGGWQSDIPSRTQAIRPVTSVIPTATQTGTEHARPSPLRPTPLSVFLVGSEAQRDAVLAVDSEATVFLARTRDEEDAAAINLYEMSEAGPVQVVDLR